MNLDFHYYGTFVAARLAGYKHEEAEIIAHAAQYVDDSNNKRILDKDSKKYISDIDQIPTVNDFAELITPEISRLLDSINSPSPFEGWTEKFYNEVFKVWPVFHFLPGNFNRQDLKEYEGEKNVEGVFSIWEFDQESEEQFKLLCLPNSGTIQEMINESRQTEQMKFLEFVGLRMHVLADTWAHMYFAGIPAWFINNAHDFSEKIESYEPRTFLHDFKIIVDNIDPKILKILDKILGIPFDDPSTFLTMISKRVPFFNSYFFLGHCLANHLPDYPSINYNFKPNWSKQKIIKNNPSDYFLAFSQMVYAMECIRNNINFEVNRYAKITESNKNVIVNILTNEKYDQTQIWKNNIPDIKDSSGDRLIVPSDYNPDKWLNEYRSSPSKNTHYYKFNKAAYEQLSFVLQYLDDNDVFLIDDFPRERIFTFLIKDSQKSEHYVSKNVVWGKNNYPSINKEPIEFEFILPNKRSGQLLSETDVKIRTTEKIGEKRYLGAWKTSTTLYYYTKDWDIFKQKWRISQENVPEGNPIDLSKPVLIMNLHFKNKPYLAPYVHPITGKIWLTTTSNKYRWYLEH